MVSSVHVGVKKVWGKAIEREDAISESTHTYLGARGGPAATTLSAALVIPGHH